MRATIACAIVLWALPCAAEEQDISYDPEDWPTYVLKLSPEGTLKDIFDAGLRPFYIPGQEHSDLRFTHCHLVVESPEGRRFPKVTGEYSDLQVIPIGLWKLTVTSPRVTLEQARNQMLFWLPLIDRSESELDAFLESVAKDFLRYDDRSFGMAPDGFFGSWRGQNRENYTVWLAKGYNPDAPLRICLRVYWLESRGINMARTRFDGPIEPPEGYEGESMEPPKYWGPDSAVTIARSRGEDIGDGFGPKYKMPSPGQRDEQDIPPQSQSRFSDADQCQSVVELKSSHLSFFIVAVLFVGVLCLFLALKVALKGTVK